MSQTYQAEISNNTNQHLSLEMLNLLNSTGNIAQALDDEYHWRATWTTKEKPIKDRKRQCMVNRHFYYYRLCRVGSDNRKVILCIPCRKAWHKTSQLSPSEFAIKTRS